MFSGTDTTGLAELTSGGGAAALDKRRVVIADRDPRVRERLRVVLTAFGMEIAGLAGDGQEAVQLVMSSSPDFVLLDDSLPVLSAFDSAHAISHSNPAVASVLMTERTGPTVLREAMQNAVRDVIQKPLDPTELMNCLVNLEGIRRLHDSQTFQNLLDPTRLPRLFCITGGKGGVGKTMVATNLALALRERSEKTVLVDLYTQFGDVAAALALKPNRTLAELTGMADDIDWPLLSGYVHTHQSGLNVLFGSDRPLPLDAISIPVLDRLIHVLKREYRYIIFDVPPYLHATTLHALSLANAVLLVCNLFDYTTISDTKQLFDTLLDGYVSRDRIKLLINRVTAQNRFQTEDVEKTFGHPVFAHVPNEPRVVSLLNTGFQSHAAIADTPLGEAIRSMADALVQPAHHAQSRALATIEAPNTERKSGLLRGWKSIFGIEGA